ncbi:MAG: LLM class F420-dependent oxidoreductase [Nocardioidaceae bacterium]
MHIRVFTEPQQGATYDDLLRVARATEDLGFDAFFRSDHYLHMSGDGLPGPTDAWATLAGLARDTSRIRLGTLMSAATFRLPGPLAITVAQVDDMSGGRVELGIGAGWFEQEHRAYGIPFPSVRERFDRYEEQVAIVTGLWETPEGGSFTYTGKHYQIEDSPARPKPAQQPRPPLIIGGSGMRRTPALAAMYADEFNAPFLDIDDTRAVFERVRRACDEDGRGAESMRFSAAQLVCVGRDEATVARRAAAIHRDVAQLRSESLTGTVAEVVDKLGALAELGISRVYAQILDLHDLDHLVLLASDVAPQLPG